MAASVEKPAGEPIILMTFDKSTNQHEVIETYMRALKIARDSDTFLFRVVDLQDAGVSYAHIIATLRELAKGVSYASVYPEMMYIVIGRDNMAEFCTRFGLPFFTTYTEVLVYVQAQVSDTLMYS